MSQGHQSCVMTSATLAVGEDFSHFTSRLGLDDARCLAFPSPFDLANNGIVYLPRGLPPPSDREHTASVLESLIPLLEMTAGGVFCLFTSHRALNNARYWFRQNRSVLGKRKLLVQGSAPRDDLTRRFRGADILNRPPRPVTRPPRRQVEPALGRTPFRPRLVRPRRTTFHRPPRGWVRMRVSASGHGASRIHPARRW